MKPEERAWCQLKKSSYLLSRGYNSESLNLAWRLFRAGYRAAMKCAERQVDSSGKTKITKLRGGTRLPKRRK